LSQSRIGVVVKLRSSWKVLQILEIVQRFVLELLELTARLELEGVPVLAVKVRATRISYQLVLPWRGP